MIKRLVKVLVVIPCLLLILPIEIIIYGIRWIVTGKDFPKQPLIGRILFNW